MRVLASAPMTRTREYEPLSMSLAPAWSAKTNPEQPAETSKPHERAAPIFCGTSQPEGGHILSRLSVPKIICAAGASGLAVSAGCSRFVFPLQAGAKLIER